MGPDSSPHVLGHAPGRPQEACQVQVRLQDPDADPAGGEEVRGGEADRDEGDDAGPVRDPRAVHLDHARLDPGPEPDCYWNTWNIPLHKCRLHPSYYPVN